MSITLPLRRLSPSKIAAFRACPQRFAFRYVDGLVEPPDPLLLRGTLVHLVCQRLFALPPARRTRLNAVALLHCLWEQLADDAPELAALFADAHAVTAWLESAEALLATWFRLEDPAAVTADGCELYVEHAEERVALSGIVDRLDRLADGTWAVTDYKTGPAPRPGWERREFFQLRFYALLLVRSRGLAISRLRLVHLAGDGEVLELGFSAAQVRGAEQQVRALAAAIDRAVAAGHWHPSVGGWCRRCAFKPRCPAWAAGQADSG